MTLIRKEALNNTRFALIHKTCIRSQILYCVTLFALVIIIATLPFLNVTIIIKGTGIMKSSIEKTELLAPVSGRVMRINLKDNQKVIKGADLLIIDNTLPMQQKGRISSRSTELIQYLHDVEDLILINKKQNSDGFKPRTRLYLASWQLYKEQFHHSTNTFQQAERSYLRYKALINKNVITKAEFEQHKFNYDQALSDQQTVIHKYKTQLQIEANQYRSELHDLQMQKTQLDENEKQHTLKATINGFIQNLAGVKEGSYIFANQKIGEINPDDFLYAYCYMSPTNIGLIKRGQSVNLQIDAFNYNQWGKLRAKVIDISEDVIIENQRPYFKIKCELASSYLQLQNGYKGYIRKGMTFTANFSLANRSLYQLLYDRIGDWLNPSY